MCENDRNLDDPTVCECRCHEYNKNLDEPCMLHMVACCEKCQDCDLNIQTGMLEAHREKFCSCQPTVMQGSIRID